LFKPKTVTAAAFVVKPACPITKLAAVPVTNVEALEKMSTRLFKVSPTKRRFELGSNPSPKGWFIPLDANPVPDGPNDACPITAAAVTGATAAFALVKRSTRLFPVSATYRTPAVSTATANGKFI